MRAEEFDLLFYQLIQKGYKPQDAFWEINNEVNKYSDYHSYRVSKFKRYKLKS